VCVCLCSASSPCLASTVFSFFFWLSVLTFALVQPESNSWMTLARGSASVGHWRPALCTLTEQGERCMLKVYVDVSILFSFFSNLVFMYAMCLMS
jgi:hypothetical protein